MSDPIMLDPTDFGARWSMTRRQVLEALAASRIPAAVRERRYRSREVRP